MSNTRSVGAIAVKLDANTLLEKARGEFAKQFPDADAALLTHGPLPQMHFAVDRGNAAVVNREGVGAIADENDTIEVYFSYGTTWVPVVLPLSHIGYATTHDRIDLAEGIRSFGSRLDANHYRWFSRYDKDNSAQ